VISTAAITVAVIIQCEYRKSGVLVVGK